MMTLLGRIPWEGGAPACGWAHILCRQPKDSHLGFLEFRVCLARRDVLYHHMHQGCLQNNTREVSATS